VSGCILKAWDGDLVVGGWSRLTAAISFTSKARCWLKYVFWFWGRRGSVAVGCWDVPFWRVVGVDIVFCDYFGESERGGRRDCNCRDSYQFGTSVDVWSVSTRQKWPRLDQVTAYQPLATSFCSQLERTINVLFESQLLSSS